MYELAPSVYAADYLEIKKQIKIMEEEGAKYLHLDIMDGHFVPGLSFGPAFVKALRSCTEMIFDVHLMVDFPGKYIHDFSAAGADIITVHVEADTKVTETLSLIHREGKKAGVVLKPSTPVESIAAPVWQQIDVIQIMTVEPGLRGQTFIPSSCEKIRKTRDIINEQLLKNPDRSIELEVDGDITPLNLRQVLSAGANIIVAGKGLFLGDLTGNIRTYMDIIQNGGYDAVSNWS